MVIQTYKPKKKQEQANPVNEKLLELNARYQNMFSDIMKTLDEYKTSPIELMRIANELQATAFEQYADNVGNYLDMKLNKKEE